MKFRRRTGEGLVRPEQTCSMIRRGYFIRGYFIIVGCGCIGEQPLTRLARGGTDRERLSDAD
jgi:hypothetical protein